MALTHAACFEHTAWSPQEFADLLSGACDFALLAEAESGAAAVAGLILCRTIAGEAEVLTLAVAPPYRRQGLARTLLLAASDVARSVGASALYLEVAADNAPAIALYESAGFERAGLRRGYYVKGRITPIDAIVYRGALNRRAG